MTSPAPLLEVDGVSVRYGERTAVQSVSFAIGPGELVAITGPNGAGKTTLLRALLGLVPVAEGRVEIQGTRLGALSYRERAQRMAWLPQDEQPQDNVPLVDYVLFGRYAHIPPLYSEDSTDFLRAENALRSVDLWDRRDSGIWEVSGGERQRVLLARALTQDAPILLLDEPTAHLDMAHQLELLERMAEWRQRGGRCVVAAMHDLNLAARYADRVIVFSRGRLVEDGRPADVLTTELLRSVWGIDAELRRDGRTGLPYLIPTLPSYVGGPSKGTPVRLPGPVHVVGGGGAAAPYLLSLVEEGFRVTAGTLPLFDTDTETARNLGLSIAVDVPFAPLGDEARAENRRLLEAARAIIVAPFAVGAANLANWEDLLPFVPQRPTYLLGGSDLDKRDFTGGRAHEVRLQLLAAGARDATTWEELLGHLRRELGVLDPSSARSVTTGGGTSKMVDRERNDVPTGEPAEEPG